MFIDNKQLANWLVNNITHQNKNPLDILIFFPHCKGLFNIENDNYKLSKSTEKSKLAADMGQRITYSLKMN